MKKIIFLALVLAGVFASCSTGSKQMKTDLDSAAYAFSSLQFAPQIAMLDSAEGLNVDVMIQAIRDVVAKNPKMTPEEANAFLQEYFTVRMPANNLKESETFLAETEKKSGVQKTASGLLYEIVEPGSDVKATNDADTVVVIYKGTLPNGTEFDSTEKHGGEPATFTLNGVIPAWTEGMKLVGKGGKIKLYAHPSIAYGEQGQGQMIRPNQALVFEVEVVDVKPAVAVVEEVEE